MKFTADEPGVEKVGRNFLWMAWSAAISVANSLVLWIVLARLRDVEELGRFTIVMGLYSLFMTVCALGLPGYLVTEISRRRARADNSHGSVEAFIANASVVMLASGAVSATVMCLFGLWASDSREVISATLVASLAIIPSGLIAVAEATMVALGRTRVIGVITTGENLLRTAVPIFLIWAGFDLTVICLSLAVTRYFALAAYLVAAGRRAREFAFDLSEVKRILLAAPTFAGMIILSSFIWQGAVVLLGRYSTEAETAKFGAASRFLIPAAILLASYADVIQPVLARVAEKSKEMTAIYLAKLLRVPLVIAIAAAIASPFLSPLVLTVLFGEKYADAAAALDIFALCLIPFCLIMIIARGLFAMNLQRYDLIANAFGVVVFLGAGVILIPEFGAAGAATAQLSALIFMALLEAVFISRVLAGFSVLKQADRAAKPRMLMIGMHLMKTRGGITTLISAICRSSISREFDITYVASQAEDFRKPAKFLLALGAAVKVAWHCIARRPDLVYVHVGSNASLYREGCLILLAKLLRRVVVTHFHAGDAELYYSKQSAPGRLLIKTALGANDSIIAVSSETAHVVRSISASDQVVVIPNAIDTAAFGPKDATSDGDVKLIFVGATGKLKGEHDLLRALSKLRSSNIDLKVSIVGFGAEDLRSECERLGIAKMIESLGPVPSTKMADRYADADIFVLPTYAEAMPMSVLEAMAASLAIVTTPVGGITELIGDGVNGLLVAPGDVDSLAEKIKDLAADPELRRRLGQAARRKVMRDFDLPRFEATLQSYLLNQLSVGSNAPAGLDLVTKRAIKSAASSVRRSRASAGVNIIAYHRVVGDLARAEKDGYFGLSISTNTFRKHCELLKANYDVMSLDDAAAALAHGSVDRPIAAITFDDGYLDFYEQAFPVLRDLRLPATMFLPTNFVSSETPLAHDRIFWLLRTARERGVSLVEPLLDAGVARRIAREFARPTASLALTERLVYMPFRLREKMIECLESAVGNSREYPADYRLLDWEMVREMAAANITFGAHTVNHVVLPLEDTDTIVREVDGSRARLETELGVPIRTFAYPNGEHSDTVRSAVADAGFTVAVTTKPTVNVRRADLLALGRTSLSEESTRGITGQYSERVALMRLGV
ncbi:MAG: glycosyltransferase [Pyrinomonadaceae bacterium]